MARTTGRSGFKMKSSPAKGKLQDFFNTIGSQLKAGQKERGIFSEAGKAEKKSRKAGESKYQADVRRKREDRKTYDRETRRRENDPLLGEIKDTSELEVGEGIVSGPKQKPKSKGDYYTFSGKKGDKFKYKRKLVEKPWIDEKTGKQSVIDGVKQVDELEVYEFQRPGSDIWETSKTKAGNEAIENLYWSDDGAYTKDPYYNSPVEKKSPTKKRSGFKMKSSPAKIYSKPKGKRTEY